MGLALNELNLLNLDDYTTLLEVWAGGEENDGDGYRRATQADINRILG